MGFISDVRDAAMNGVYHPMYQISVIDAIKISLAHFYRTILLIDLV